MGAAGVGGDRRVLNERYAPALWPDDPGERAAGRLLVSASKTSPSRTTRSGAGRRKRSRGSRRSSASSTCCWRAHRGSPGGSWARRHRLSAVAPSRREMLGISLEPWPSLAGGSTAPASVLRSRPSESSSRRCDGRDHRRGRCASSARSRLRPPRRSQHAPVHGRHGRAVRSAGQGEFPGAQHLDVQELMTLTQEQIRERLGPVRGRRAPWRTATPARAPSSRRRSSAPRATAPRTTAARGMSGRETSRCPSRSARPQRGRRDRDRGRRFQPRCERASQR